MFVGNPVCERSFRLNVSVVIALIFAAIFTCGLVSAQQGRTGGPTPSPEGAGVISSVSMMAQVFRQR